MKERKILVNFYVPRNLKNTFDSICYNYGYSRTAALLTLMSQFVEEKAPEIEKAEKQMESINNQLSKTRKMISFNEFIRQSEDDEKASNDHDPVGFFSNGSPETEVNNF